jgi:hypothetical protein
VTGQLLCIYVGLCLFSEVYVGLSISVLLTRTGPFGLDLKHLVFAYVGERNVTCHLSEIEGVFNNINCTLLWGRANNTM